VAPSLCVCVCIFGYAIPSHLQPPPYPCYRELFNVWFYMRELLSAES
jgi:hypothetical protein